MMRQSRHNGDKPFGGSGPARFWRLVSFRPRRAKGLTAVAFLFAFLIAPSVGSGHHSISAFYEPGVSAEIEGTVTSVLWRNPHVRLTLLVENERGETEAFELEGGTLNNLRRRGFGPESVRIGSRVRAVGRPSNRGRNELFVTLLHLPDGQEIPFGDVLDPQQRAAERQSAVAPSRTAANSSGIFKVWSYDRLYRLHAPLALTPAAQAARDAWNPVTDDPALRCEAPGMPNAIMNPYPIEFIDEGNRIQLRIEEWDAVRWIDLAASAAADVNPGPLGYSRGRWDGGTLVVETSRVDWPYLDDRGTPQSEDVRMVERFSVNEDGTRLAYQITVTDPENLLEPAVWEAAWVWVPGVQILPFECSDG